MIKPIIGIGSDVLVTPGMRDRTYQYDTYTEAVRAAGAIAVIIPPQPENAALLMERLDGVLLAGGFDCDPALYGEERHPSVETMHQRRQENDLSLARQARRHGVPTLGICLGLQVMNVAAGGSLVQDIETQVETGIQHASLPEDRVRHDVVIAENTGLAAILCTAEMNVNSSHHQSVKVLGEGFRVTAHAPDGVVEGLEDPAHPFYVGVQWHPEDMKGESSATSIFGAFIAAARAFATTRRVAATEPLQLAGTSPE